MVAESGVERFVRSNWISVGGGFGQEVSEALISSFMRDASKAADFLCGAVTDVVLNPEGSPAIDELYIVFEDHPEGVGYELRQITGNENGTLVYAASSHWLTAEHADDRSGPWRLLAVLCEVLVSLDREGEIRLPALPGPPGGW